VDADAGDVNVRLIVPGDGAIEGSLIGFRGRVKVTVEGPSLYKAADVEGDRFSFAAVAAGTYRIAAVADRAAYAGNIEVTEGEPTRVVLRAEGMATVEGVARDLRTGQAIAGAMCQSRPGGRGTATDEAGRFVLEVPAGTQVKVTCAKLAFMEEASRSRTLEVPAGGRQAIEIPFVIRGRGQWRGQGVGFYFDEEGLVTQVSDSQAGGVQPGDRLLRVEGLEVVGLGQAITLLLLTDRPRGDTAPITVRRGDAEIQLAVPVYTRN
jgi:hypothetical protein